MINKIRNILLPGLFPFTICFFLLVFILLYRFFNLPSPTELIVILEGWFNQYGLWLLFTASFFEGIFVIGMYFPGSLAIALAIYALGKSFWDLFFIGGVAFLAFLIANIINYYLGKFGYYKILLFLGGKQTISKMQTTMERQGYRVFFLTGFFPNFIAITSICAGISNLNIFKTIFFQTTSLLFWVTIWTVVGSLIISRLNLEDNNQILYVLLAIFLWGVFLIIKELFSKNKKNAGSQK